MHARFRISLVIICLIVAGIDAAHAAGKPAKGPLVMTRGELEWCMTNSHVIKEIAARMDAQNDSMLKAQAELQTMEADLQLRKEKVDPYDKASVDACNAEAATYRQAVERFNARIPSSDRDATEHNALASELNLRCASKRYRLEDKRALERPR